MRYYLLLTVCILLSVLTRPCFSENDSLKITKNAVYLELIGTSSTMFSVHYDRVIKQLKRSYLNLDAGFGYFPRFDILNPNIGIPVSLNWTNRLHKRNHLETGIGITYSSGTFQQRLGSTNETESLECIYGSLKLGYKFQNPQKDLFLKIALTPLIKLYQFSQIHQGYDILPFIGLSTGYSF